VKWALAVGIMVAIALPLAYGQWRLTALGLFFAAWIVATALLNFVERVQHTGRPQLPGHCHQPAAQLLRHAPGAHRHRRIRRRRHDGQLLSG
jgi:cytochrome c-type biogenesis protein CcmF